MVARLKAAASTLRLGALVCLVLLVTAMHLGLVDLLVRRTSDLFDLRAQPNRLEVVYVSEMTLAPPSETSKPETKSRPRRVSAAQALPKTSPGPSAKRALEPELAPLPERPRPNEDDALEEDDTSRSADEAAPDAPDVPPFEWPVSTRLHYDLTGYVRGEVYGQASVEWIRQGQRYQVHLDVEIGPSFSPMATRRMSSDGDITPEGLRPRRYDQETRIGLSEPMRAEVSFEDGQVRLANGQTQPGLPGVQDAVSQFIQLSWTFDAEPSRLRVGEVVEVPLALPRRLSVWVYDVVGEESIQTLFGEVPAYHLKPRATAGATSDLIADVWIAPGYRHLPIRLRIQQDADNHIDLILDQPPQLGAIP